MDQGRLQIVSNNDGHICACHDFAAAYYANKAQVLSKH